MTGGSFPTYASFAASRSRADVQPATTVLLASPSSDLATLLSSAADFLEAKHGRTDAEESEFVWLEMLCLPPHSVRTAASQSRFAQNCLSAPAVARLAATTCASGHDRCFLNLLDG